jgi:hypothetical protein
MSTTPVLARIAKHLLVTLIASAIGLLALAGPAGAETPPHTPDISAKAPVDPPPPPPPPLPVGPLDLHIIPLRPTATAQVNCETGQVDVQVGNKTSNAWMIAIAADGDVVDGGPLAPGSALLAHVEIAENQTMQIEVTGGADITILDTEVTADCLVALPSYEVLTDCDSAQAHARLLNHGDDTASMGIQYPAVMHMEIDVAAHSSEDWLLAVTPGETVEFDVVVSNESIGTEQLTFNCPPDEETPVEPVPEAETPVDQTTTDDTDSVDEGTVDEGTVAEADEGTVATDDEDLADDDGVEELASGTEIRLANDAPNSAVALGIVLIGLGLAALAGVVIVTTATRTHRRSGR